MLSTNAVRRAMRRRSERRPLHVHFHSGPDRRPVPCFEAGCPNPRLTVPARTGSEADPA